MIEALDIIIPINGVKMLTVISCERGCEPSAYYCVDENGNGDWFAEDEIRIAKTSDLKLKKHDKSIIQTRRGKAIYKKPSSKKRRS